MSKPEESNGEKLGYLAFFSKTIWLYGRNAEDRPLATLPESPQGEGVPVSLPLAVPMMLHGPLAFTRAQSAWEASKVKLKFNNFYQILNLK